MHRTLPHLLIAVVLFGGCGTSEGGPPDDGITIINAYEGLWQDRSAVPIRFELEQTFGAEEEPIEAALSFVSGIVTDEAGNVFVMDGLNDERILSFTRDGTFRWVYEANGRGPGELFQTAGLAWLPDQGLVVSNQGGTRLDRFGPDGAYVGGTKIDVDGFQSARIEGTLPPDRLLLANSGGWLKTEAKIVRFGAALDVITSLTVDRSGGIGPAGMWYVLPTFAFGEDVAIADVGTYRITRYDTTGSVTREVCRETTELVRPGYAESEGRSAAMNFGGLGDAFQIDDGYWIATVSWPTNVEDPDTFVRDRLDRRPGLPHPEYAHSIDLYDAHDRLLYVLRGEGGEPEIGRLRHADRDGRLYTSVNEPYPQVRRYRVVITP